MKQAKDYSNFLRGGFVPLNKKVLIVLGDAMMDIFLVYEMIFSKYVIFYVFLIFNLSI